MHINFTYVTGQEESYDLAAAIGKQFVTAGPSCQDQLDVGGLAPLLFDVFT